MLYEKPRQERWHEQITPTYQPQSSMINIRRAGRELSRKNLMNKIYPFLIVAGLVGLDMYFSCNEPEGKPLEGFDQRAYEEGARSRQY